MQIHLGFHSFRFIRRRGGAASVISETRNFGIKQFESNFPHEEIQRNDISNVSPSAERIRGLWVVCVYIGMEELCHWWKNW